MGKLADYAAAFFLLGDSLKDCLGVCLRQLDDWQLAVMIARIYEGDDGLHLKNLLHDHIVPMAFAKGYRRLASWAFWMLKRRDLAIRVIVVSRFWKICSTSRLTLLSDSVRRALSECR